MENSRRNFLKKTITGSAALTIGGVLPGFSAKSYNRIAGANEKVLIGIMGVNSRGLAHAANCSKMSGCEIIHICDVDSRATAKCVDTVKKLQGSNPKPTPDFRKALEDKSLEAMFIATPDHWHAPAGILAC